MPKLDDQISTLQQKLHQLKLRQQRLDARERAVIGLRERKLDTRRKILVGSLVLEKLRLGEMDRQLLSEWLDRGLTRAADRALFNLPAAQPSAENPAPSGTCAAGEPQLPPRFEGDDGDGVR